MQRKVKPLHPGTIVIDILEDRGISVEKSSNNYLESKEILEGKRPMTYVFAFEMNLRFNAY